MTFANFTRKKIPSMTIDSPTVSVRNPKESSTNVDRNMDDMRERAIVRSSNSRVFIILKQMNVVRELQKKR